MRTLMREKIYVCGDYLQVYAFPVRKSGKGGRGTKAKPTCEAMQRYNKDQRKEKIHRMLLNSFTKYDIKCELTYAKKRNPKSDEEAIRDIRNFLRRLKRHRAEKGLPETKAFFVPEKGSVSGQYHFHAVLQGDLTPLEVKELWGNGMIRKYTPLQFDTCGLVGLSDYLGKKPIGKQAYIKTRNIKDVEPRTRDGYISARKCRALVIDREDYREWADMYPGYTLASLPDATENEIYGGCYVRLRYIRTGTKTDNWWDGLPDYDGKEVLQDG